MPFHGRGRGGKQHLQRRFLRKRGAGAAKTEIVNVDVKLDKSDIHVDVLERGE